MKNAPELADLWTDITDAGSACLRPNFSGRVMARRRAEIHAELSNRSILTIGLGTAIACLTLTVAFSAWKARHSSNQAMAQWSAFHVIEQDT